MILKSDVIYGIMHHEKLASYTINRKREIKFRALLYDLFKKCVYVLDQFGKSLLIAIVFFSITQKWVGSNFGYDLFFRIFHALYS